MQFLKDFFVYFGKAVWSFLLSLVKLLFLLLLLIPLLIAKISEWLKKIFTRKNFKEIKLKDPCVLPFPEDVIRRPDPCIYSQTYLIEQNLPVTWNNPDIWVSKKITPGIIEPDSYHLEANTDYIASVRVHNASVDAAIGVRVRLVYRPWSFNSPDQVPVETDGAGNEVVKIINVAPMGSTIVQFNWHTPAVDPSEGSKHFCIQAVLHHPMDINIKNNLGQENTQVYSQVSARLLPDEPVQFEVPLFNHARTATRFAFKAFHYKMDEKETVQLKLKSNTGRMKLNSVQKIKRLIPAMNPGNTKGRNTNVLGLEWVTDIVTIKNRYTGYEEVKAGMQKTSYKLPPHLKLTIEGDEEFTLGPGENRKVKFRIDNTGNHPVETTYEITVAAITQHGTTAGGITIKFTY